MTTASRVALASAAAGVLAATAAGLAATPRGRAFTRKARQKIQPVVRERLSNVINAFESTLEDYGVLDLLPDNIRQRMHQRLAKLARTPAHTPASSRKRRRSRASSTGTTRRRRGATARSRRTTTSPRSAAESAGEM